MSGHRPFSGLKKNWSQKRLAAVAAERRALEQEAATLEEPRIALGISQEAPLSLEVIAHNPDGRS